ncbi:MAG: proline--tRNA ligase [Clostridiaceae bacterium]|nr:proline--tRNA ligase [Clostridiaceae bacterium]
MILSKSYFFTLREDSREEDSTSGNLLVRSGMIKKVGSGIYALLPLGLRVFEKIKRIVREEMNAIGSQELTMPALIPEDVYIDSGRRDAFGDSMFALKDRYGKPYVLGPTHEELFAAAAKMYINSFRDMPVSLYQFQTKYRDEPRPRFGLIRVREFVMKDAYTFDRDEAGLDAAYAAMYGAYERAFDRMGLNYVIVRASTGVMGGLLSEEFQAVCDIGEDILVLEDNSGYASNLEVAECVVEGELDTSNLLPYEEVHTPNAGTIAEVTAFLNQPVEKFVKTLIYRIDGELYALCLRGDHEVNETKVLNLLGALNMELAAPEDVAAATRAPVGFAGPIGLDLPIIMDRQVGVMSNFIVGANKGDYHYMNVNLSDFTPTRVADIRQIKEGDLCANGAGRVRFARGIEVGNTFKLGEKYSKAMDLYYTDADNHLHPVVMGSYGIGIGRCLAAIVEQNHNELGIVWPKQIAPVQVAIVVINMKNEQQVEAGFDLYEELSATGLDILIDDRNERAGVKFMDMDLIGVPLRITVGRDIVDGCVELKFQGESEAVVVPLTEVRERVEAWFVD